MKRPTQPQPKKKPVRELLPARLAEIRGGDAVLSDPSLTMEDKIMLA